MFGPIPDILLCHAEGGRQCRFVCVRRFHLLLLQCVFSVGMCVWCRVG